MEIPRGCPRAGLGAQRSPPRLTCWLCRPPDPKQNLAAARSPSVALLVSALTQILWLP